MSTVQKVKAHIKKHKAVYITGGACLAVGALGGGLFMATRPEMLVQQKNFIAWKPRQEVLQVKVSIEELSTPSKPIIDEMNKTVYNSISDAVRKTGRSRWSIKTDPNFKFVDTAEAVAA